MFSTSFIPLVFIVTCLPGFTSITSFSNSKVPEGVTIPPVDPPDELPPPVLGLLVELFATFPFGAVISTFPVTG